MTKQSLTISPAPVRKSLIVPAHPAHAFDVFANRMHDWSPAVQSLSRSRQKIVIEPHAGGRWYEVASDGGEADWGKVLIWEPPLRMVLAWQLDADFAYDPSLTTEVDVRFAAVGGESTRIELEHRNLERFGARAADVSSSLDSDGGWTGSFAMLAELMNREAEKK